MGREEGEKEGESLYLQNCVMQNNKSKYEKCIIFETYTKIFDTVKFSSCFAFPIWFDFFLLFMKLPEFLSFGFLICSYRFCSFFCIPLASEN